MRRRALLMMVESPHNGHAAHPAVSIVLPTYQRGALIGRAIRSVLAQTLQRLRAPRRGRRLDRRHRRRGRAHHRSAPALHAARRQPRRAAARNLGIRATAAPLLAFQDSDDEWLPNKLERHLQVLAAGGPDVGVVYSDMERVRRRRPQRVPPVARSRRRTPDRSGDRLLPGLQASAFSRRSSAGTVSTAVGASTSGSRRSRISSCSFACRGASPSIISKSRSSGTTRPTGSRRTNAAKGIARTPVAGDL